ncbi:MAG: fimbrial biogenesis chaperone [Gammaproteobacteria bacterium]
MVRTKKGKVVLSAAFPFLLFSSWVLQAATVAVVPVRVEMETGVRSATITLSNEGSAATSIQADISEWTQDEDGRDVFSDTDDIIAVPGIFEIPPGGKQIVRIGLLSDVAGPLEKSYRVFLTEIAQAGESMEGSGLRIRLRLSVPLFIQSTEEANPVLKLVRADMEDDALAVVLHNEGNQHVQIRSLTTKSSAYDRQSDTVTRTSAYLLPGTARKFKLAVSPETPATSLVVDTDMIGVVGYEIPVRH